MTDRDENIGQRRLSMQDASAQQTAERGVPTARRPAARRAPLAQGARRSWRSSPVLGIGAALIVALARTGRRQPAPNELFTTENRPTADELRRLPSDYSGIPQLGAGAARRSRPADPRARRKKGVRCRRQPLPGPDPEEQRRLAEHGSRAHQRTLLRRAGVAEHRPVSHTGLDLASGLPPPSSGRAAHADRAGTATGVPRPAGRSPHGVTRSRRAAAIALRATGRRGHSRRARHRHPLRPARSDRRPGHPERL